MKVEVDENSKKAYVRFDSFYVPTLEGKKNVLQMKHPAELLSELSKASSLEELVVQPEVYGASNSDLKEIEHEMKTLFYNSYMHYDETLHTGKLGVLQNIPYALFFGYIPFSSAIKMLHNPKVKSKTMGLITSIPSALLFFTFALDHIGKIVKTSKVLKAARKFKEESLEIADRLEAKEGSNAELTEKALQLEQYFNSLDGSAPEIYLKMADKASQLDMLQVKKFYLELFNQNKATERMGEKFKKSIHKYFTELFSNKETKAIKVKKDDVLKPLIKENTYKINFDFLSLPTKDALELYFLKKINLPGSGQMTVSLTQKQDETNSLAHLVTEKSVKINARLFVPYKLSDEQIRKIKESINSSIYQREYFQQKYVPTSVAASLRKSKVGYFLFIWGCMARSPILMGFGLLDMVFGKIIRERQAEHATETATGYDSLYDIKDMTQIEDKRLATLADIIKDDKPYEAYTKAAHYAMQRGLDDIAGLYWEKALFYQRKFKEPSKSIMNIEKIIKNSKK